MTAPGPFPKISLAQQIEAVRFAETRARSFAAGLTVRPLRGRSTEEYDRERLGAAARTLEWLQANEAEIKALLLARQKPSLPGGPLA